MQNLNVQGGGSAVSAAQTVPADGNYDLVVTIGTAGISKLTLTGTVGGTGPLTGLQLTGAAVAGGTHVAMLVDNDFANFAGKAPPWLLRSLNLQTPTNIVTGTKFQFTVELLGAVPEVGLYAKTLAGATVAVEAFGRNQ